MVVRGAADGLAARAARGSDASLVVRGCSDASALSDAREGYIQPDGDFWTNGSVLAFAAGRDPLDAVEEAARTVVFEAVEDGAV